MHTATAHRSRPVAGRRRLTTWFAAIAATLGLALTGVIAPTAAMAAPGAGGPAVVAATGGVTTTITGRIVTPEGAPAEGVAVELYPYGFGGDGMLPDAEAVTGADGRFSVSVLDSEYSVRLVVIAGGSYLDTSLRENGTLAVIGESPVREFAAETGTTDTGDLTLVRGTLVSGTVTASGLPGAIRGFVDVLDESTYTWFSREISIVNGTTPWSVAVLPGSYEVALYASAIKNGAIDTTSVTVDADPVSGIALTVPAPSGSSLSGVVTDKRGAPVADATVNFELRGGDWTGARSGTTNADGSFTVLNLAPGAYVISVWSNEISTYWPGVTNYADAEPITVEASSGALTGYDLTVFDGVSFSGVISNTTAGEPVMVSYQAEGQSYPYSKYLVTRDGETRYTVDNLAAGTYTVSVAYADGGTYRQWYDGAFDVDDSTPVALEVDGDSATGIDFALTSGGTISGAVVDADGVPFVGASVSLYRATSTQNSVSSTVTGADGSYTFPHLAVDNYLVKVVGGEPLSAERWFGQLAPGDEKTIIELGTDQTFTADIVSGLGGSLSGTLFAEEQNASKQLVLESVDGSYSSSTNLWFGMGDSVSWSFAGLEPGDYTLRVESDYWPDGVAQEQAVPLTVVAGEAQEGISFDLRGEPSAVVTIDVADGSGLSYANLTLQRWEEAEGGEYWSYQDFAYGSTNTFSFRNLPEARYRVIVNGETADRGALRAVIHEFTTVGATGPVAVTVPTQRGWAVNGTVTDAVTGAGVSSVMVNSQSVDVDFPSIYSLSTAPKSNGIYSLGIGAPGVWDISVSTSNTPYIGTKRQVTVAGSDLTGIDFALVKGATISGRVTAENNGASLSNIYVYVYNAEGMYVSQVSTDSNGRFTTGGLAPGDYTLSFYNSGGLYIEEWWDSATSGSAATTVTVGATDITGINATMRLGGVITGTITDEDGMPLVGATVGLATPPASGIQAFFAPFMSILATPPSPILGIETITDVNGQYTLPAVDAGDYALYVYTPTRGTVWSGGSSTLSGSSAQRVQSGARTFLDMTLPSLPSGQEPRTPAQSISDEFEIQQDPADVSVVEGGTATFTAEASGATVPSVQWQVKQTGDSEFRDLDGQTSTMLELTDLQLVDSGTSVRAVFTLGEQTRTSAVAQVEVTAAPKAPAAPAAPTVTAITDTAANVAWTAPADNGSLITGYTVTVSAGAEVVKTYELAPTTSLLVSGLASQTAYTVRVVAHNGIGSSAASAAAAFTTKAPATVPGAPTGVSAVAGNASATVSWTAPASNGGSSITGYTVTSSPGGIVVNAGAVATSVSVPGLTNGTAYTFTVVAKNAVGSSVASGASAAVTPKAPATVPGAPTGVSAVAANRSATVSWTAPASNGGSAITGYTVTASPGGTSVGAAAGATSVIVPALDNGTAYTFTVVAINAVGSSVASGASAPVTPQAAATVPGVPTGVSAVAGDASATVSWTAPASNGGSAITGYAVTSSPGGVTVNAAAGATSVVVPGLANGTAYTFTVAAINAVGPSPLSTASAAVTPVAPVAPGGISDRLAGPGRYETSAKISEATFAPGVPVAYLATGLKFPDALAGAAAAGHAGGPVLLTDPSTLHPAVKTELERLKPQRIVLLGDANSVSGAVADQVRAYTTGNVDRIAGIDRYATSSQIALDSFAGAADVDVVYLATGLKFPDALAGAAAGGSLGGPVLLTMPDVLPAATRTALDTLNPKRIVLLGDENSISTAVRDAVAAYASQGVERKAGIDRYATAAAIATEFGTDVPVVYLATGLNFPDALSGAAAAGYQDGPVLLTMPGVLPQAARDALQALKPRKIVVLGDQNSVQDAVLAAAEAYVVR